MKYGNIKQNYDSIFFDSRKEARRYAELKLLERAGQISDLEIQKKFELIPTQYETFERYGKNGKRLKDGKKCIAYCLLEHITVCEINRKISESITNSKLIIRSAENDL